MLSIGDGEEPICDHLSPFAIRVPDRILAPREWTHTELARHVFPGSVQQQCKVHNQIARQKIRQCWGERAILTATNAMVDEVNAHILEELDKATLMTYHSVDEVDSNTPDEQALWPVDFLNSLTPSGMPPHALTLGPGALVMLLRNLDADAGLCNGVRAMVVHAFPKVLDVLLVSGSKAGARVFIPRLVLAPKTLTCRVCSDGDNPQ